MQSIAVEEHGYIVQHVQLSFEPSLVMPPLGSLLLQATEEALRDSVVPAVPFTTHATHEATSVQQMSVGLAGIL